MLKTLGLLTIFTLLLIMTLGCNETDNEESTQLELLRESNDQLQKEVRDLRKDVQELQDASAAGTIEELQIDTNNPKGNQDEPQNTKPNETNELREQLAQVQEELELLRGNPEVRPVAGNICQRSIAVQEALLERLDIQYCRYITGEELIRVTNLGFTTKSLQPGDFDGLHNLETLSVGAENPPPEDLFKGLNNLTELHLSFNSTSSPWKVEEVFSTPLPRLVSLRLDGGEITEESAGLILTKDSFSQLPQLETVRVEGIREIDEKALEGLPKLKRLELETWDYNDYTVDPSQTPALPDHLIANLPELRHFERTGFTEPETMELANHKVVCQLQGYGSNREGTHVRWWTVEEKPTKIIRQDNGACRVGIGSSIAEIENGVYAEELLIDTSTPD